MRYRFKYFTKIVFVLLLSFPVFAQASSCFEKGYTVIFINGVFDTEQQAQEDKKALSKALKERLNGEPVTYSVGYNRTHGGGLGDLFELYFPSFSQYDVDTILMQMHTDVTTRKILLVGHSQGAIYANKIYEYLTTHGAPKEDVAIYAVATPDNYVAGGGKYITYSLDDVIGIDTPFFVRLHPLSANATFLEWFNSTDNDNSPPQGHSFIDMYLGGFGTRMVHDMQDEMAGLKSTAGTAKDGCFDPPPDTLTRKLQTGVLAATDPIGSTLVMGAKAAGTATVVAAKTTAAAVGAIGNGLGFVGSALGFGASSPASGGPKTSSVSGFDAAGFTLIKAVMGSSLSLPDLKELNSSQGGAVASAFQPPPVAKAAAPKPAVVGEVKGVETQKPDIPAVFPNAPLIPPPPTFGGSGGISPGFGGGGGGSSAPPAQAARTATITYTFTAADANGVSTVCSFDTDTPVACSGSFSKELGAGEHVFTVVATDVVGNQTTQTRHFTVLP